MCLARTDSTLPLVHVSMYRNTSLLRGVYFTPQLEFTPTKHSDATDWDDMGAIRASERV